MKKYFSSTPHRVSHTISRSPAVQNIPRNSNTRKANVNKPSPLAAGKGRRSRCASCGKQRF